jgi:hypothetical protein
VVIAEAGRFEVLEDPDLVAEIATLREALPRRGRRGAGS